ncbi:hypothetical protein Tagg_0884 [Thermosphaera aggregans DSM 11486]|uniref:Uncharacterized protein n=1 Tax=Thermosphaera aggregans (strain DSM 11486 / M11TL) TaxID=633148 RepID=D5U206_THEAM|nr:hypothetical protein Tagg_0884 [Thermosphaera aggregans DSM 11486]
MTTVAFAIILFVSDSLMSYGNFDGELVLGKEAHWVYLTLKRENRKRALILLEECLYALMYEVLVGVILCLVAEIRVLRVSLSATIPLSAVRAA